MENVNNFQITDGQRANLSTLLDVLIPAYDGFLGAGALGIAPFVESRMHDTQGFARVLQAVLVGIETLLAEAGVQALMDLAPGDRVALVRRVEASDPMTFLSFLTQVYMGYYTHPSIPPKFGFPDRPPQPLGHALPEDDNLDELLTPVRQRGRHYRLC